MKRRRKRAPRKKKNKRKTRERKQTHLRPLLLFTLSSVYICFAHFCIVFAHVPFILYYLCSCSRNIVYRTTNLSAIYFEFKTSSHRLSKNLPSLQDLFTIINTFKTSTPIFTALNFTIASPNCCNPSDISLFSDFPYIPLPPQQDPHPV